MQRISITLFATALLSAWAPFEPARGDDHARAATKPIHWSYEGAEAPEFWGALDTSFSACANGSNQSPVDLQASSPKDIRGVDFHYRSSALRMQNNGHTVGAKYDSGSYISMSGARYNLLQFHIHSPSEHKIDGKRFDAEIHLVHQSNAGKVSVVAILLTASAMTDNPAYKPLFDRLPKNITETPSAIPAVAVDAARMLPKLMSSFRYTGSLTTPPCTEGVSWIVLTDPVPVSKSQISAFRAIFPHGNARPLQPLNGRPVLRSAMVR